MNETPQAPRADRARRIAQTIREIWSGEVEEIRGGVATARPARRVIETLLFFREVSRGLVRISSTGRASGLAFTTLLSLIPLIAALWQVIRTYFAQIFPELKGHLDTILNLLLPYQSAQITHHITRAVENTAALSTFGTIVFIIVTFRLFMSVESVVNITWKVQGARTYRQRIRAFTMLFFWGPIVIGLSLSTSSTIQLSPFVGRLLASELAQFAIEIGTFFVAFTMLFWLVPATKVRIRSAALGAGVTAVLFELVRFGLGIYSTWLFQGTMNVVYGTLGFLVIFLISLELMWLVILLGVEISYVHQNLHTILRVSTRRLTDEPRFDVFFGLLALAAVVRRYQNRDDAPTAETLADELGATDAQMRAILKRLESAKLVRELTGSRGGWMPAGDPAAIRIAEVVHALEGGGRRGVPRATSDIAGAAAVGSVIEAVESSTVEALDDRSLCDLVDEIYHSSSEE